MCNLIVYGEHVRMNTRVYAQGLAGVRFLFSVITRGPSQYQEIRVTGFHLKNSLILIQLSNRHDDIT
jgi:hypothetical protein